jgi:hypothetical protein
MTRVVISMRILVSLRLASCTALIIVALVGQTVRPNASANVQNTAACALSTSPETTCTTDTVRVQESSVAGPHARIYPTPFRPNSLIFLAPK